MFESKYQCKTEWSNLISRFKQSITKPNGGLRDKVVHIFHKVIDVDCLYFGNNFLLE